ncbi:MAG TPA: DUF1580 domain-containing protein [Pirellulales bacterium]
MRLESSHPAGFEVMTSNAIPKDLIPLGDVASLLPWNPSATTILGWTTRGVIGPNKKRVRLRSLRIGAKRWVSRAAVDQFIADLNVSGGDDASSEVPHHGG